MTVVLIESNPVRLVTLPRAMLGEVCKIWRVTVVDESSCRAVALADGSMPGGLDARNSRKMKRTVERRRWRVKKSRKRRFGERPPAIGG